MPFDISGMPERSGSILEPTLRRVEPIPFGIRGMPELSAEEEKRRRGNTIGLAKAFAKGYIGIYAEVYAATFAAGYAEGAVEHARETLLRQGGKKLGAPAARVEAEIAALDDVDRLNDLIDRVLDVSSWDELLAPPTPTT